MKKYKILNLYACLGGNRYKWDELHDNLEITAVELDQELARLYQERFPNDIVIVADAHQYLLDHYKEYDFIWTSPPCPSHTRINTSQKNRESWKPKYPSMILYEEIIFLDNFFNGKYCVENVIPYYEPLILAKKRGRHLYWTNFNLPTSLGERKTIGISRAIDEQNKLCKFHNINLSTYKGEQSKTKIARNLVDYEAGKTILETVLNINKANNVKQGQLF
jgi:DNA (cytosine-5)-methyltransferase 1